MASLFTLRGLALLGGLAFAFAPRSAWGGDGALAWRTIDTRNFQLTYPSNLEAIAQRAARIAEQAHADIAPLLGHSPRLRTQMLLTDFGDFANGSATALPRPRIHIFAAPPALDGNLNDYDDWLRLLIYHEYTHVIHLDQVEGVPRFLNRIFGRTFAPNQSLPPFDLEGTAVWVESLGGRGRIHSALFRGYLRTQALAGRLQSIDAVVHVPDEWPGANVWYLYGGHFIDWIARTRSPAVIRRMNRSYADDLIPMALNRGAKEASGESMAGLWRAWQADLIARSEVERAALAGAPGGLSDLQRLTSGGRTHKRPRFLPDGSLISIDSVEGRRRGLYRRQLGGGSPGGAFLGRLYGIDNVDVCARTGTLLVDRAELHRGAYNHYDLHLVSLESGAERRLTRGARVREPACAPSGAWAAAVQLRAGGARLVRIDLAAGDLTTLHDPGGLGTVASPVVSADGRVVVISQIARGERDLVAVDAASGALTRLTRDLATELHPRFSPDGRWLLYASDRSGIFDIYALPWPQALEGAEPRRLTRVVGGALEPIVSPDGDRLVVRVIGPDGFDLAALPFDPERSPPLSLGPAPAARPTPAPAEWIDAPPLASRTYEPLETLAPLAWFPSVAFTDIEQTTSQLGVSLEGGDIAGHHSYLGDFSASPEAEAFDVSLAYGYRRLTPTLAGSLARATRVRPDGLVFRSQGHPYRENVTAVQGSVSLPFARAASRSGVTLRYSRNWAEGAENVDPVHDPLDVAPSAPEARQGADVSFGVRLSNTEAYPLSISNELGRVASLTMRVRDPLFGGEARTAEVFPAYQEFIDLWGHHTLALRFNGAYGRSDRGRVQYRLGGVPERNVLLDALDNVFFGQNFLRGYPADTQIGDRYVLATAEYRLPLVDVFGGISTLPIFLKRLKLAAFSDWGQASDRALEAEVGAFSKSVGGELLTEATLFWRQPFNVRLGFAQGLDRAGESQLYFFLGNWF